VGTEPQKEPPPWSTLRGFLCHLFMKLGAPTHDAEDLAQESLARVMGRRGGDGNPVSLGFAATVGRNLWRDRLRVRMRRSGHETAPPSEELAALGDGPPDLAAKNEDARSLEAALEALDPRHRDAIVLVVLQRTSYADAARLLGVPRGTVKSRIHYGIQHLRGRLGAGALDRAVGRRVEGC
jgi:RNA polymerase sigma-70 factor (ECF subfamily)